VELSVLGENHANALETDCVVCELRARDCGGLVDEERRFWLVGFAGRGGNCVGSDAVRNFAAMRSSRVNANGSQDA
jgi:hypothetical protein